jgi:homoprotocatechuate degradation regulator HpaR
MSTLPASTASVAEPAHEGASAIGSALPMLLLHARETVMQRFRPHLRRHAITEQQWRILRALAEHGEADMRELAGHCRILPASLTRTVALLVRRGLVARRGGEEDQRRVLVSLADDGRALFLAMIGETSAIYRQLEAQIGSQRLADVQRVLFELIALSREVA